MPDLLPCPWCAAVPELQPANYRGFFIECENHACLIAPKTVREYETPEEAAAVWNARPVPQEAIPQPA